MHAVAKVIVLSGLVLAACGRGEARARGSDVESPQTQAAGALDRAGAAAPGPVGTPEDRTDPALAAVVPGGARRTPNELGRIPILEYHLIGEEDGRWTRSYASFRRDLERLYAQGYRPITVAELVDGAIDLPAGLSPVVFTFDDASPGQFRYLEEGGKLVIDPASAVGIWLAFSQQHADWGRKAVFCMLSGAEEGRSFFGNKGIEGQKTEWRLKKVKFLADQGFELCNHTLWHAKLSSYDDATVQEQIARGVLAIDSAAPGYRVRTFALPLGQWPKNRALAQAGQWTDPKSGRTIQYRNDAILMVAGGPARSPHDPEFDPLRLPRVQVFADELEKTLEHLDRPGKRYVSDGDRSKVARPAPAPGVTPR